MGKILGSLWGSWKVIDRVSSRELESAGAEW